VAAVAVHHRDHHGRIFANGDPLVDRLLDARGQQRRSRDGRQRWNGAQREQQQARTFHGVRTRTGITRMLTAVREPIVVGAVDREKQLAFGYDAAPRAILSSIHRGLVEVLVLMRAGQVGCPARVAWQGPALDGRLRAMTSGGTRK